MEGKLTKKMKPNCYDCKHRRNLAGSAHSSCQHPSLQRVTDDPMLQLMGIFASVGRAPKILISNKQLNVKGNERGIKRGWFNFPLNYDPIWLENCDGFEMEEKEQ